MCYLTVNYDETSQKRILREMERDLLAIIAMDLETDEYEVIYSGGAYRNFENRYHNKDFFAAWNEVGIALVFEPDRERMRREISKEYLLDKLSENRTFRWSSPSAEGRSATRRFTGPSGKTGRIATRT